jgi:Mg-chelatase subunit ChlI
MPRIVLVAQDKGGAGKTLLVRGLAECLPSARLIEIEADHRLVELDDRLAFKPLAPSSTLRSTPSRRRPARPSSISVPTRPPRSCR